MEDARQRVTRWMEEAPSFLEMVAQVVDDRQRALAAAADTERECAQLRDECDGLKRDRSETGAMLAEALGRAGDALMRMRPLADLGVAPPTVPPPPSPDPEPVALTEPPADPGERVGARRVLLVDDDKNFRNVITEYLEDVRGYDVRVAVSGEEGLSALEHYQPDIVLLDLMMPGIGGMSALQRMKTLYPSLCVVMVTANEDLSLARQALALGAADYVTKPFDLDYLDAVLNIYLSKSESSQESELAAFAAADGPGPVASAARSLRSYFTRR